MLKKNTYLVFFFCVISFNISFSQNNNTPVKSYAFSNETLKTRICRIDSLISIKEQENIDSLHLYYQDYAYWLYDIGRKETSIFYEEKAFEFAKSFHVSDSLFLQKTTHYLGFYYRMNYDLLKAIDVLNLSLKYAVNDTHRIKVYEDLGHCYQYLNDLENELLYNKLAISLLNKNVINQRDTKTIIRLYYNTSLANSKIRLDYNIKEAIHYAELADSISRKVNSNWETKYKINILLGTCYNRNQNLVLEKAEMYYNKSLKLAKENNDERKIGEVYKWLGNLYNTTDVEKSMLFLNRSIPYLDSKDSLVMGSFYTNYMLTKAFMKDYPSGLEAGYIGLSYSIGRFDGNVEIKSAIVRLKNKWFVIRLLSHIAETYLKYYEQENVPKLLDKSIEFFKLTDFVIELQKQNSNEYRSKLYWQKLSADIYGKAIRASYLKGDMEQAFYFMEKNKAILLMEDIATQNFREALSIPKEQRDRETEMKTKLFLVNNSLRNQANLSKIEIDSLKRAQLDLERELMLFQKSVYKDPKQLKEPPILSIKDVQKDLQDQEVFVEYHVSIDDGYGIYTNRDKAYALFITKTNSQLFEIPNQPKLKEAVTTLNSLQQTPFATTEDQELYSKTAYQVYNTLFPTNRIKTLVKDKKLIIAPDSYLSLIPFESLVTDKSALHYLIEDANISYLYSYSFTQNNTKQQETESITFLGIAPLEFNYDDLNDLTYSGDEFTALQKHYRGQVFTKQEAVKDTFLHNLSKYNMIHLATHANAQDSINPWIAFADKKLTLDELYLAKSKASLVVLSACNTTLGKQEVGEGVMSLARGFFYTGTQSVVSSLWAVDDTTTPVIMNDFYTNLSHGETKSEALWHAKRTYINTHSLSELSPHYWASFILLGEDDVLQSDTFPWWGVVLGVVLLGVFLWVYFIKRKQ